MKYRLIGKKNVLPDIILMKMKVNFDISKLVKNLYFKVI